MNEYRIGERSIGSGHSPYLIAEIGINHGGQVDIARTLIQKAAAAGADAVKFQTFETARFITKRSPYFDLLDEARLTRAEFASLKETALSEGIEFFSSVFDEESADMMDEIGVRAFKIASGDLTHHPLIRHVAKKNKPMVISTGGATVGEIEEALEAARSGNAAVSIALLHCVSKYPTAVEETNLCCLQTLSKQFGCVIGFSDHTQTEYSAIAAVALGASIIEKHFTYDRNAEGPDHALSMDPAQLARLLEGIKTAWAARGATSKTPVEDRDLIKQIRRSLTAAIDIPAGTEIRAEMIQVKRPGTGIAPADIEFAVGRKAVRDLVEDTTITWSDIA